LVIFLIPIDGVVATLRLMFFKWFFVAMV